MQYYRQYVVDALKNAGYRDAAIDAERELPDPVEYNRVADWAMKRGITIDGLISRMGGSP